MDRGITVFILAAGFSSRMGRFKPLLPFPEEPLIARQIKWLRAAGIADIRVVTGHSAELLDPILSAAGVRRIHNERYGEGMFSSVLAAMKDLPDRPLPSAFSILPADLPLLYPEVLYRIFSAFKPSREAILFPCFKGERGHPPVIPIGLAPQILRYTGPGGLGGFIESSGVRGFDFETGYPGVLADIDTPEEYRDALAALRAFQRPGGDACLRLFEAYGVPPAIRAHCAVVAEDAGKMAASLHGHGYPADVALTVSAALMHDIAKGERNHAARGAAILRFHGLEDAAGIVARHMDFDPSPDELLSETALVFLADKRTDGVLRVPLAEREARSLLIHDAAEAEGPIRRRFSAARRIEKAFTEAVGAEELSALVNEGGTRGPFST